MENNLHDHRAKIGKGVVIRKSDIATCITCGCSWEDGNPACPRCSVLVEDLAKISRSAQDLSVEDLVQDLEDLMKIYRNFRSKYEKVVLKGEYLPYGEDILDWMNSIQIDDFGHVIDTIKKNGLKI